MSAAAQMKRKERASSQVSVLCSRSGEVYMPLDFGKNQVIFAQGDPADAIFQIRKGKVKLSVSSQAGKEAVISLLGGGDFFGEACLAGQAVRLATATALSECSVVRLPKNHVTQLLQDDPAFSGEFLSYALGRIIRIEEDLVDQLFNSSEKRLARTLLLLANFGKESDPEPVIPRVSQETLAEMIGTTRSRVSFFMNRFRKLGYIEYAGDIKVHSSLLSVLLKD